MTHDRLDDALRRFLPVLARRTLEAAAAGQPSPTAAATADVAGLPLPDGLDAPRGVFVTLTVGGRLRGCIGVIEAVRPLGDAVQENALAAGYRDPRFEPLTADEMDDLHIEVSVLTPMRKVGGPDDIEIPRHGVLLTKGGRRAVFLPQVAEEQGWDRDTTLTQLALKAGLDPDDWREGATFSVFEADAIHEHR